MSNDTPDWTNTHLTTFGDDALVAQVPAASGVDTLETFTLPIGTLSLAFRTVVTSGVTVRPAILSIEDSTGNAYAVQNPIDTLNWAFCPAVDIAGLTVDLNNNVGSGDANLRTDVYALPVPVATAFYDRGNQTILPVQRNGDPLSWEAPNLFPVRISGVIAAGANLLLRAGAAGQTIRLFDIPLTFDAVVATGDLSLDETSSGTKRVTWNQSVTVPALFSGRGVKLAVGEGAQLHNNNGAAAITVRGAAMLSQA